LFGLFLRSTNLMEPRSETIQSDLPILGFIQFHRYTCTYPCSPPGFCITTRLGSSDSSGFSCPGPRAWRKPELGACGLFLLLIRVAQRQRGSPADRPEFHPSRSSCAALEFFYYDSEPVFILFILVSRHCAYQ